MGRFIRSVKGFFGKTANRLLITVSRPFIGTKSIQLLELAWKVRLRTCSTPLILLLRDISEISEGIGEFLGKEDLKVPVYDALGSAVGQKNFSTWVYKTQKSYIHHGTSYVINHEKEEAFGDVNVRHPNYKNAHESFHYIYRNVAIFLDDKIITSEIPRGILFCGKASHNYFHLLTEIFSRFYALHKFNVDPSYPLLVDEIVLKVIQFKELLTILNTDQRLIIPILKGERYLVHDLLIPSDGTRMPLNVYDPKSFQPLDFITNPDAIRFIRMVTLNSLKDLSFDQDKMPKRLFISRKPNLSNRQVNEDELWRVAENFGFVKICPEDHSITEQVIMFSNCEYITGNSGAAFSNIVFTNERVKILYWTSTENSHFNTFTSLAKATKAEINYISGLQSDLQNIHTSFYVDPKKFERALMNFLSDKN